MMLLLSIGGVCACVFALIFATLRSLPQRVEQQLEFGVEFDQVDIKTKRRRSTDSATVDSAFLARAIEATASIADRRGIVASVERQLRRGDIPVRAAEAVFFWVVAVIVLGPLGFFVFGLTWKFGVFTAVIVFGPGLYLKKYVGRRMKKFERQLPDMLGGLSASLRAGRSLGQAMENLATEMVDPMGRELRKVVAENQLGWPLADSLQQAAERIESDDFDWAVMAMKIQADVGGNLAELLDQVAETMRHREQFKGEVKALTAEGQASAMLLVAMPPLLGIVMYTLNRAYIEVLLTTGVGNVILGVSAVMLVSGWFAMQKVMKVDV